MISLSHVDTFSWTEPLVMNQLILLLRAIRLGSNIQKSGIESICTQYNYYIVPKVDWVLVKRKLTLNQLSRNEKLILEVLKGTSVP